MSRPCIRHQVATLLIVSRQDPWLAAYYQEAVRDSYVTVIIDRRHGERQRHGAAVALQASDYRRGDRRHHPEIDSRIAELGFAVVETGGQ